MGGSAAATVNQLNLISVGDNFVREKIDVLRQGLSNADVETFTYKPLVGLSSKTDFRGVTEYYEFDHLNRLVAIKNHVGFIKKTYNYSVNKSLTNGFTSVAPGAHEFDIYELTNKKIITVMSGSQNPNDYAFSSFELNAADDYNFIEHNLYIEQQAGGDGYSGSYGMDAMEWGAYITTEKALDPNKEYVYSYKYRTYDDWDTGWQSVSKVVTGVSYISEFFIEMVIDDFMVYPLDSSGKMYLHREHGQIVGHIPFN